MNPQHSRTIRHTIDLLKRRVPDANHLIADLQSIIEQPDNHEFRQTTKVAKSKKDKL